MTTMGMAELPKFKERFRNYRFGWMMKAPKRYNEVLVHELYKPIRVRYKVNTHRANCGRVVILSHPSRFKEFELTSLPILSEGDDVLSSVWTAMIDGFTVGYVFDVGDFLVLKLRDREVRI
ncbi:hypothetical protein FXO38_29281 [Capsicum annuum]|nr:hypothetical protein FXO38_29281 [Capsicum annuum]